MSNNKTIFPNVLKNEKIFRELLKALTGSDPGHLEHLLLCGRDEQTCEINLSVDYSVFEDDNYNLYTLGVFHEPMIPEGYLSFLNDVTTAYTVAKYGYCTPMLNRTIVTLIPIHELEHCEENEFFIPMWEKQENPAIAEMLAVLLDDEHTPITALGKAALEYLVGIWGENYWE